MLTELLRSEGFDVMTFSGGKAAAFMDAAGHQVEDIVSDPVPEVVNGEMKRTALWYLRSWAALRGTRGRTEELFDSYRPDLVVCDEEFSGILVAQSRKCKHALISDELELGFARGRISSYIERRVDRWYKALQASVDLLLIPDQGQDEGNKRFIGPIVRKATKSREQVISEYGLPRSGRMLLFCMSGSGIGDYLLGKVIAALRNGVVPGGYLVVSGNRGKKVLGSDVHDLGVVQDNQNLVAAADLVVSTAGKSTIDEAANSGTPIIVIPIRHHAEQERNAATLGYTSSDAERLEELISEKIGRREPRKSFQGERTALRLLMPMLQEQSSGRAS